MTRERPAIGAFSMTSFLYNHITTQWDPVQADHIAANVYRVPNLPGDEEQYLEIPAEVGLSNYHLERN
jgi:hypothetical protein